MKLPDYIFVVLTFVKILIEDIQKMENMKKLNKITFNNTKIDIHKTT